MNKKYKILIALIVIVIIAFAFIINLKSTGYVTLNQKSPKIKIGVMALMTGPIGYIGENDLRTMKLALKDLGYSNNIQLMFSQSQL